ncbi:hypothetical protein [Agathobaculum sp.]|uniref:hypothetical protein n=1 Tax=Agathobaculum sp. TaxID=2048138 RepID=UPI002A82FF0E|nr:hypothetical protein [Agathobaculum sp.]MDY3617440.1 hypothetical protein [Agathobaculum sp.]
MTSKNSLSERGLLRDGLRRNLWSIVLSVLGFFFSLLLPTLMTMQSALEQQQYTVGNTPEQLADMWARAVENVHKMLGGANPLPKLVMVVLAVVCGVALFSYLHSRQKVDFYHSLPVSRARLFATNFLTGIVCVLPAWAIMEAITVACAYAMGFGAAVDWASIGGAVIGNVVFFLLLYALSALAAILCGNTIISLLLLLWIYFAPAAVRLLQGGLFEKFFSTYVGASMYMESTLRLSPVMQYFFMDGLRFADGLHGSAGLLLGAYALCAVLAIALGCYLFRIRKSERAGTALAFEPIKVPVKVFMCVVGGVAAALLFNTVGNGFWFWPGLVIGVVLFHWLIEIIYAFDFHAIFGKPMHLIAVLVAMLAGLQLMQFDVFGYDSWLPGEEDIAAVDLNWAVDMENPAMETAENIVAVRRLAEIGIGSIDEEGYAYGEGPMLESYTIVYRLKSGRTAARSYLLPMVDEVNSLLNQVKASEEYKRVKWPLYTFNPADYKDADGRDTASIGVITNGGGLADASEVQIIDPAQIDKVLETLREESLSHSDSAAPALCLALQYEASGYDWARSDRRYTASVGEAYVTEEDTKTLALIEQLTGVVPTAIDPADIEGISLRFWGKEHSAYIEVTDEADKKALLQDAINSDMMRVYNGQENIGLYLDEDDNYHMSIVAETKYTSFTLRYPVGKTPKALIEKYRIEAEQQTESGESGVSDAIVKEYALG